MAPSTAGSSVEHSTMRRFLSKSLAAIEPLEPRRLLASVSALAEQLESAPVALHSALRQAPVGSFDLSAGIGSPAIAGTAAFSNGLYTITAAGSDIAGTSDQFHFISDPLSGNGVFTARVASLANTNSGAKAGLMIRSGSEANAAFVALVLTPSSGLQLITRSAIGGSAGSTALGGLTAPRWARLVRAGDSISGFWSNDGITWNTIGTTQSVALGATPRIGLAVTSRNVSSATTATFTNVSYLLPDGLAHNDIGNPANPGGASYDGATDSYLVNSGGSGIGATADVFSLLSRNITLGGPATALLDANSLAAGNSAGVMIRAGVAGNAVFAAVAVRDSNLEFTTRSATGGASAVVASIALPASSIWLRLTQSPTSVAASFSTDGVNFTALGTAQSITFPSAAANAGMYAAAATGGYASAAFSRFSLLAGDYARTTIGAPANVGSSVFDAPSNTSTVTGVGQGFAAAGDALSFIHKPMFADGNVVAYVNSLAGPAAARAGVMLRSTLAADAPFAAMTVTPGGAVAFVYRTTTGGTVVQQSASGTPGVPLSLRLTRTGNNVTGLYSTDGITFLPIGTAVGMVLPGTAQAGAFVSSGDAVQTATASITGVAAGKNLPPGAGVYSAADELFLHDLSQRSVNFFYTETNASTGMAPDGSNANGGSPSAVSSIASTGFALSSLIIAAERGFLTRADAYQRALNTVNFLNTTAAQVNGFFYHFINPITGARAGSSELSPMDTALLMAGVLHVAQYWAGTPLAAVAQTVFNRVDWPWMQKPNGQFYGQWTPENGFEFGYGDFSEAVLIYLLGLGSSTFPTATSSWNSWSRSPVINYNGFNFITAQTGALFTTQYPLGWFDLRGLSDSFGLNYPNNAATASLAQRQMAVNLSGTYSQYGLNNWGFTAADGQSGYTVWGGPPPTSNINGTVVPTAPGGALAFIPRQGIDALKHMRATYGSTVYKKYGFVDAFNPHNGWTSSIVLGIDVGMMLLAAENARSGLIWNTFNQHPAARTAKARAFPTLRPELLSAVSRKNDPSLGNYDLAVPLTDALQIDDRTGGPTQVVLNFGAAIVKGASFNITPSSGSVVSSTASGTTLTINLAGVADASIFTLAINDVRHSVGSTGGNYTVRVGALAGDADRSGAVNLDDFTLLAGRFGQTNGAFQPADFNFDGSVTLDDFTVLAAQFGKTLPAARAMQGSATTFSDAPLAPRPVSELDARARHLHDLLTDLPA